MPYPGIKDPAMISKMDRCVREVMATGKSKEASIAICYSSIMGKEIDAKAEKEMQDWMSEWSQYAVKVY